MSPTRRTALAALAGLAGCPTTRERPGDAASAPTGGPSSDVPTTTAGGSVEPTTTGGADPTAAGSPTPASAVETTADVTYRETSEATLELDVVRPAGVEPAPVVLYAHGGGWRSGDRRQFRPQAEWLARRGYAGLLVEYRLSGEATYPAAVHDVAAAAGWTRANADRLGLDADRLALAGWSAGAHLSALVAAAPDRFAPADAPAVPTVRAVAGFSGIYDLTSEPIAGASIVRAFLGGAIEDHPGRYREASPVTHVDGTEPPALLLHAADDPLVPIGQSRAFRDALRDAGTRASLYTAAAGGHAFFRREPEFARTTRRLRTFLDAVV